jgi:adenosylmethionine-8-amino-7-oxononanoate aminotransferase
LQAKNNFADDVPTVDAKHFQPLGTWTSEQLDKSRAENPFAMGWGPNKARHAVPNMTHGEGVYLFDDKGNKYLDWTSQAVCSNLGHDLPEAVIKAAEYQMRLLPYAYGDIGQPEVRTRMNQLMNEILPGDLRAAVYPSSGSEANEAGIMMARRYTGRQKIISWYRSYHGATSNSSAATGDSRRWLNGDSTPGFVKAFNPYPLFFKPGGQNATEAEMVESSLVMLEEQILNEGPDNIASIMTESVLGAGGCIVFPEGYMQGIRALCDQYGILMHVDEVSFGSCSILFLFFLYLTHYVMSSIIHWYSSLTPSIYLPSIIIPKLKLQVMMGFGRTGKMFGFQNYDGVVPDIVTCAKGISSSAVPMSMVACSGEVLDFFEDKSIGWGSTYQGHPVAMAVSYENTKYILQNNIVGRVQAIAPLFESCMQRLVEDHPSIKQYRAIGLFGCLDVQDINGKNPKLQHEAAHEAFFEYKKEYNRQGLVGLHRYPHIHCAPPLSITEDELIDGFERLDRALDVLDEALGFHSNHIDQNNDEVAAV